MPLKLKLKKIKVKKMPKSIEREAEPAIWPPSFSINEKQMPEIKKWNVGKKYRLVIDVEMKNKNENLNESISGGFDLTDYKYIPKKGVLEMNEEEFEEEEGRQLQKMSER